MTTKYWAGIAGFCVLAIVGGPFLDVISVAGAAVVALAGASIKRRTH